MIKRTIPVALAAMLALAGCGHATLESDTLSCERLADFSDRKVCMDKVKTQEREWEKRKD